MTEQEARDLLRDIPLLNFSELKNWEGRTADVLEAISIAMPDDSSFEEARYVIEMIASSAAIMPLLSRLGVHVLMPENLSALDLIDLIRRDIANSRG